MAYLASLMVLKCAGDWWSGEQQSNGRGMHYGIVLVW